jgi:phage N-6-adenine-methyltransferase
MKMNQKGRGNDEFETPDYIFQQLNAIFNFEIDVASDVTNSKCSYYISKKDDSLTKYWSGRCFCNPPFSKKAEFIKKAHEQVQGGWCQICVMILPLNSMDTKVWHEIIEGRYHYEILKGRIAFIDPQTKQPRKGNNSGTVIVYFKKRIEV